jgi:hypothetical protein
MIRCHQDLVTETIVPSVRETQMKILKKVPQLSEGPKVPSKILHVSEKDMRKLTEEHKEAEKKAKNTSPRI